VEVPVVPLIPGSGQTSLFYTDWGAGRPVVLLHGWALDARMWEGQQTFLAAQGLRCVSYDRRGHGRSDVPGDGYDYDTLADDLAAVLSGLDLHEVLLVAHSMAAGEAVRYLSRHGDDRVSGLVVVGGTTPCLVATDDDPSGVARELLGASTELLRTDRAGWFRAGTPAYFGRPDAEPLTPWMQDGLDMCLQTPLPVLLACGQTMVDADLRSDVRGVRVPTLVVHGDTDASAPLP